MSPHPVNNEIYNKLGDRWYTADDDPVALLRAEGRLKNPWVLSTIARKFHNHSCSILDIGCGAGFLTHALADAGHQVIGVDTSQESLDVAQNHDTRSGAQFLQMSAYDLHRFKPASFDVVCAMDFLEHVEHPQKIIQGISRILKPGGLFFFHTFNRNWLSWLIVIKGVEWFVKNAPKHLHVYSLFIKPSELGSWARQSGFNKIQYLGMRPKILSRSFIHLLWTGKVDPTFQFAFTPSLLLSYTGVATRESGMHGGRFD